MRARAGQRYLGQGELSRARSMARRTATITLACSSVLGIGLMALSGVIPRCFTSDPAVLRRLQTLLPILAIHQPMVALMFLSEGLLVGAKEVT